MNKRLLKNVTFICQVPRFGQFGLGEKGGESNTARQGLGVVKRTI